VQYYLLSCVRLFVRVYALLFVGLLVCNIAGGQQYKSVCERFVEVWTRGRGGGGRSVRLRFSTTRSSSHRRSHKVGFGAHRTVCVLGWLLPGVADGPECVCVCVCVRV
jgi:hypothetical protein